MNYFGTVKRDVWDVKKNDNAVKIFRPIPPKGYIALGDVAVKYDEDVKDLKIKCIPEYCLKKMSLGPFGMEK